MSMKTPERLFDYFTLEANEQLAILEEEASKETQPAAGRFIAAARQLTSSAQMARLTSLAEIASGIEKIAKDVIRKKIPWSNELREAVLAGIRELRVSVARVKELDEADYIRLRRHSREVMTFAITGDAEFSGPIPISNLFFDDAGPHIIRLAHSDGGEPPLTTPTSRRGKELKNLLDSSIARLGGDSDKKPAKASARDKILPIDQLLYRGRAALDRAREIGSRVRAEKRAPLTEEMTELYDLLDLAATEAQ